MTPPKEATPSAGALRAARLIFHHMPPFDLKVLATAHEIDRETHAGELLEALEGITENAEYQRGTTYEIATKWIEQAEAALAKARKP